MSATWQNRRVPLIFCLSDNNLVATYSQKYLCTLEVCSCRSFGIHIEMAKPQ